MTIIISFISALAVIGLDQLTKFLIYGTVARSIIGDVLWFQSTLNTGVAFSMFEGKSWIFIVFSGIATGLSWLCYYRALQDGPISVVLPIDKLSTVVSIAFAYIVFKEKLTKKSALGLVLIVAGTLGMVIL